MVKSSVNFLAFLFLLAGGPSAPAEEAPPAPPEAGPAEEEFVPLDDPSTGEEYGLWFPVGEEIEYKVYWGRIPVARSITTSSWVEHKGTKLLAIRIRTKSNRVIRTIYPVDDIIETIVDPETFLPVRFTKNLKEGRYRCHEVTTFDHQKGEAHLVKVAKKKTKSYEIEPDTRDLVSFMFSMRRTTFEESSSQEFQVMADEKLYDLTVNSGKKKKVSTRKYGKVESIPLSPQAAFQGLFVRKGKMDLWVSTDDRRLITEARIKVPVASVRLVLQDVKGPGDDFWITKGKKLKDEKKKDEGERE